MTEPQTSDHLIRTFLNETRLNAELQAANARLDDLARRERVLIEAIDDLDDASSAYATNNPDLPPEFLDGYVEGMLAACRRLQAISRASRRAGVIEDVRTLLATVDLDDLPRDN